MSSVQPMIDETGTLIRARLEELEHRACELTQEQDAIRRAIISFKRLLAILDGEKPGEGRSERAESVHKRVRRFALESGGQFYYSDVVAALATERGVTRRKATNAVGTVLSNCPEFRRLERGRWEIVDERGGQPS